LFGFPGFSKESGKSKLKNSEIKKNPIIKGEIQSKKQFFHCLDFTDFMFGFPGFKFGFRSFYFRLLIVFLFGFPGFLFRLPGFLFLFPICPLFSPRNPVWEVIISRNQMPRGERAVLKSKNRNQN
jgi:hypothetical protein